MMNTRRGFFATIAALFAGRKAVAANPRVIAPISSGAMKTLIAQSDYLKGRETARWLATEKLRDRLRSELPLIGMDGHRLVPTKDGGLQREATPYAYSNGRIIRRKDQECKR